MDYFIVESAAGAPREQRRKIAGPFQTVSSMVGALEELLDQKASGSHMPARYLWWIDQDGPEQHLVVEPKAPDHVM